MFRGRAQSISSLSSSTAETGQQADRVHSKAVEDLGLEWSVPDEPTHGLLDKWFLLGCRQQSSCHRPTPFLPAVHEELTKKWRAPYFVRVNPSTTLALTTVDSTEETGYSKLPPLEETVAAYLYPLSALGLKAHAAHPSKPCRTTSSLANRAYAAAGQAGSALHAMAVLQVFQAKLLCNMDESGQHQEAFKELLSNNLALRATKATVQAISKTMATASSQKAPATQPQQKAEPGHQQHPWMAKRFPFPKCQGPHPRVVLDPDPTKPS